MTIGAADFRNWRLQVLRALGAEDCSSCWLQELTTAGAGSCRTLGLQKLRTAEDAGREALLYFLFSQVEKN